MQKSKLGGRQKSSEWEETYKVENVVHCKHCKEVLSGKILRIKTHLSKCNEFKKYLEGNKAKTASEKNCVEDDLLNYSSDAEVECLNIPTPEPSISGNIY